MDVYKKRILRSSNGAVLTTSEGEILRVLDTSDITVEGLEKIIRYPKVKPCFRLTVLNHDETINYEIPQEDIVLDTGTYTEEYTQGQRKSLTISLINEHGKYTPSVNGLWYDAKFKFDVGLQYKEVTKWFDRGVYVVSNINTSNSNSQKQTVIQLSDKFFTLKGKKGTLDTTYEIPVGSNIQNVIIDILSMDTGNGEVLDIKPIMYDTFFEDKVMPYTLSKTSGATFGDIILDLAYILDAECYYNEYGNLCFVPMYSASTDIHKPILWRFKDYDLEVGDINITYDVENAVNTIYVVGDSINGAIFRGFAENNNMASPLRVEQIGRRINAPISDSNIYTNELAQERAEWELRQITFQYANVDMRSFFIPTLFVNTIILINNEFYNWNSEKLLIHSLSFNIGSNPVMSIKATNINDLPFTGRV